jgi:ribosomal protein S5
LQGKSDKPNVAVQIAQNDAKKKMITIPRWHKTIGTSLLVKFRGTKIYMTQKKLGSGTTGNHQNFKIMKILNFHQDIRFYNLWVKLLVLKI